MEDIISTLHQMGLNERESALYIALLNVGPAPASVVSRRTKMPKSSAKYACRQLVKKGFCSVAVKDGTHIFSPEPPEKILLLLERDEQAIARKRERMRRVVGPLKQLMHPDMVLPAVRFFEGREGIHHMYLQLLEIGSPICAVKESLRAFAQYPEDVLEFERRRVERGIPNRSIVAPSENPTAVTDPARFTQVRFYDPKFLSLTCNATMCADHLCIVSFEQSAPVAIDIQNRDIAANAQQLFELVWRFLGPRAERRQPARG